jgi:hypothetical protein
MNPFTSRFEYFIRFLIHLAPSENITLDPLEIICIRSVALEVSLRIAGKRK